MSTSVDDLVISLTIDPGSDLGKLKKQLDGLLGVGGDLKTFDVKGDIKDIATRIKNMEYNINRILPMTGAAPTEPAKQRHMAGAALINVMQMTPEPFIDIFMAAGSGYIQRQMKKYGVTTPDELREIYRGVIQEETIKLTEVSEGVSTMAGHKITKFIEWWREMIALAGPGGPTQTIGGTMFGKRKDFFEESPFQAEIQRIFQQLLGADVEREYPVYTIKSEAFERPEIKEAIKSIGEGLLGDLAEETVLTYKQKRKLEELTGEKKLFERPEFLDALISEIKGVEGFEKDYPRLSEFLREQGFEGSERILIAEAKKAITDKETIRALVDRLRRHGIVGQHIILTPDIGSFVKEWAEKEYPDLKIFELPYTRRDIEKIPTDIDLREAQHRLSGIELGIKERQQKLFGYQKDIETPGIVDAINHLKEEIEKQKDEYEKLSAIIATATHTGMLRE